jgi:hypothetical protein
MKSIQDLAFKLYPGHVSIHVPRGGPVEAILKINWFYYYTKSKSCNGFVKNVTFVSKSLLYISSYFLYFFRNISKHSVKSKSNFFDGGCHSLRFIEVKKYNNEQNQSYNIFWLFLNIQSFRALFLWKWTRKSVSNKHMGGCLMPSIWTDKVLHLNIFWSSVYKLPFLNSYFYRCKNLLVYCSDRNRM